MPIGSEFEEPTVDRNASADVELWHHPAMQQLGRIPKSFVDIVSSGTVGW
jgi:hypothetical protein